MDEKLTKKQALILDFISTFISETGLSPSYREIAMALGLSSPASVAEHVDNLIEKGYLSKNPGSARSLEVINKCNLEVIEAFRKKMVTATKTEQEVLKKAAKILGFSLN